MPPPEVHDTVICVVESAVANGDVGLGGTPKVVPLTVTPDDRSGVPFPFAAHTLNEYWVFAVSPVTAWDVPVTPVNCADAQSAGAVAPD